MTVHRDPCTGRLLLAGIVNDRPDGFGRKRGRERQWTHMTSGFDFAVQWR